MRLSEGIRQLPANLDVDEVFLEEATRRVGKDGTLSLKGKAFEAGPRYIGRKVKVLFDPFDLRKLVLVDHDGRREIIYPVDLAGNRRVRRQPEVEAHEDHGPNLSSIERLAQQQEEHDMEEGSDE